MDQIISAGGSVAAIVPKLWSQKFTQNLRAALPFNSAIARDYEGEIQSLGDTVYIPTLPDGAVATVENEGSTAEAQAITASTTALVINQRVICDFVITDQSRLQSIGYMDNLRDIAINAIMQKMQLLIIAAIIPSASNPDHTIAYTSGTTLAKADISSAKRLLDKQNVPQENRILVTGTDQDNDLTNILEFINSQYNPAGVAGGGAPSVTGAVRNPVLGFTPAPTTAAGSTSYAFHRSFMQMAVQKALTLTLYDQGVVGKRSYRLNVDLLFGLKQNFNTRVVQIG